MSIRKQPKSVTSFLSALSTYPTAFLVLVFVHASASAAIINVPGDFPTIQGAINAAAVSGDEIIVAPGTYPEAINFLGKAINLHSASGDPSNTIIDGTGKNNSVVLCISGEGPGTILEGFTITGGVGHPVGRRGGGMYNLSMGRNSTNSCGTTPIPSIPRPALNRPLFDATETRSAKSSDGSSIRVLDEDMPAVLLSPIM